LIAQMPELSIKIGGQNYKLKESKQEFSVLTANPEAIDKLRKKKNVKNITQVAPGVQVINSASPKSRDTLMNEIRKTGISHHVYEVVDKELPQRLVITDRVNIKFKENVPKEEREELLRRYHLQFRKEMAPNLYSCQLTNETGMNPIKLCSKLQDNEKIEYIEPDFVMRHKLFELTIQDKLFRDAWHLNDEVNIPFVRKGSNIKAKGAWQITKGDPNVIVAVMDDGFELKNPDLKRKVKFPSDFTRTEAVSGNPESIGPDDDLPLAEATENRKDYHGTPCAGLALASEGYGRVIGVAPGCSFMPVRWNVEGSTQDLILEIFQYISQRADVVSCSWGTIPIPFGRLSNTIHDTINQLVQNGGRRGKGLVICFAAGNEDLPTYLSAQKNKKGLEYYNGMPPEIHFKRREIHGGWPEIDGVIVVAACTSMNRKSLYSNWGPHITVAAPSDNWHPIGPSTRKKYHSVNLVTTDNELHGLGLFNVGLSDTEEGYVTHGMGGTSGATPIVAGVCGLMLSANPNLTAKRVKEILEETGNKTDIDFKLDEMLFNNKGQTGGFTGENEHSLWFGYGKVDAEAAVLKSKNEMA
jgi:subtilisin family serine protease